MTTATKPPRRTPRPTVDPDANENPAMAAPPAAPARDEYLDASSNARQFNVLRFAELTIFVTATGALVAGTFSRVAAPSAPEIAVALKVAGVLVTGVFWVLHRRTMIYWRHFVNRAAELEPILGYRQYSTRPREGWMPGSRAVDLLYLVTAVFWLVAIFALPPAA